MAQTSAPPPVAVSALIVSERTWRAWVGASLALYALIQFLYVTGTPLQPITLPDNLPAGRANKTLLVGLGPDEKEHFLYVLSLAEQGRLPAPDLARRTSPNAFVSYQAQHPPLFYAFAALIYKVVRPLGAETVWYILRGLCALCGAAVVVLAARASRVAFPDRPIVALGMAPFVAFLPMFGHMTAHLSNEPLAMVFGAWAWLQMARIARSEENAPCLREYALLGLALGLAGLTRLTALLWLPAALVVLGYAARRGGWRPAPLLACAGCFLLLLLPWLVRSELVYQTPFLRTFNRPLLLEGATLTDFLRGEAPPPREFPVSVTPRYTALWYASTSWLPFWLVQFYAPGGGVRTAAAWQAVFLLVDAAVLVVLLLHASRARRGEIEEKERDPAGRALLWAAGVAVAFCVGALVQQQLFSDWNVVLSAGRYTVAAAPASALLFLFALSTLRGARRAAGAVAVVMFVFGLYAVLLVRQFYADHPAQPNVQRVAA